MTTELKPLTAEEIMEIKAMSEALLDRTWAARELLPHKLASDLVRACVNIDALTAERDALRSALNASTETVSALTISMEETTRMLQPE